MRGFVVCVLFALSLAACGGAGRSSNLPFGAPDVLAFAPATTEGVVAIEFDVLRETPSVYGPLAASFDRSAVELPIVERCAAAYVVFDELDDGWSVIFDCQGLTATDLDAVVAATFGPDDPVRVDRAGIIVAGRMTTRLHADEPLRPATRTASAVAGLREVRRRRDRSALLRGSYAFSDAARQRIARMGEEPSERELMSQIARALRDVRGSVAVEGDALRWSVSIGSPDEDGARLVAGFAAIMRNVASETAADASASDRFMARFFGRAEIEPDGTTVRLSGVAPDLEAQIALLSEVAGEGDDDEPVARPPRAGRAAPRTRTVIVGSGSGGGGPPDFAGTIARLEPQRDAIVARFPVDPDAMRDLEALFVAYSALGRASDTVALVDAASASATSRQVALDAATEFFLHDHRGRAKAMRGDLDAAIAEFDAAIAAAELPQIAAPVHQARAFALAELGRFDEANQGFDHAYPPGLRLPTTVDEAVAAEETVFGYWTMIENNRAWIAFLANRSADGLPRIEAVRAAIARRPVPPGRGASYANTHANLLFALGRLDDAAAAHRDELALRGDAYGVDDPRRAIALHSMSRVEAQLHHGEKAVRYARTAAELLDRTRTRTHPETALAHLRLAQALLENGSAPEAHAEAALAVELFRASTEPTSTTRREAEAFLAAHP